MEKKFVALRVLFAADPASVNLTDLRKMKRFAENNLQELQGWNDGQKLNGDYAIEGWYIIWKMSSKTSTKNSGAAWN